MPEIPQWLFEGMERADGAFRPDRQIIYRAAMPSTNSLGMEKLSEGAPHGTVIITDDQQRGRGQQGTVWHSSPRENLTFSLILRPEIPASKLFALSMSVALALRDAVSRFCPRETVQIKWPNDLLLNRKKAAGILMESQWEGGKLRGTVIGIGVNVNQVDFPDDIRHRATSIARETGRSMDRGPLLWAILDCLDPWLAQLQSGSSPERVYVNALYGYHEPVPVRWADGEGSYPILGVNHQGHVAMQLPEGIRHFDLKEIEFIL